MALAAAPDVPGFQALSPLGYGPTSTIYSAQSTTLGRWVSLTVYSASLPDERSQKKFRRAFELTRRLGVHPAAVTMLDCGLTSDKHAFVATEIYERGTLEARSQGRPLPVDDVLRIGVALAGALETAHRAEVIHGGVHPARVLLGNDGEPALADLGLVALVEKGGLAALTGPVSTAYHAPPEVLEGEAVTPASDVFSLASTLYTALAGRPPYQRDSEDDTPASLLLRILQHDVPPVGRPDVPPSLEDALRRALSCSPRDRPGRALAFARELQTCQQELGQRATEPAVVHVPAGLELAVADDAGAPGLVGEAGGFPGGLAASGPSAGEFPAAPAAPAGPPMLPPPPVAGAGASVFPDALTAEPRRPEPPAAPPVPTPAPAPPPVAAVSPAPAPLPNVAPSPSSNGASPVQRVFIPYPAPEPPDPLHRDENGDTPAAAPAPTGLADGGPSDPAPGAVVPLFPAGPQADRPAPPPARPDAPIGLPAFQPDGPPVPPDLGAIESPVASKPAPVWPEHPGAGDPSERRDGMPWLQIPVGDDSDPAAGAPPWPGPSSNGDAGASGPAGSAGSAVRGDVEPDGFMWPDDAAALGRTATPDGLSVQEGPKRNGNGLSAGIGAGWPDTPGRSGAAADPNPNEWPYVADRPARGATASAGAAVDAAPAPVVPLHEGHDHGTPAGTDLGSGGWAPSPTLTPVPVIDGGDHASGDPAAGAAPVETHAGVARALPVIAVGVIVAVLTLGVAWVVMFGEDPGESANQSTTSAPPPGELQGDTGAGQEVTAVENPNGVQLDWGATDGPQVVLILSDAQPPRTLPARTGSALMVPASSLAPDVGYCFAVVPATDPLPTPTDLAADLADGAIAPDACIRGATASTVVRQ
jgi:hypothetical protein